MPLARKTYVQTPYSLRPAFPGNGSRSERLKLLEKPKDENHMRSQPQIVRECTLVKGEGTFRACELQRRIDAARVPLAADGLVVQPRAHHVDGTDAERGDGGGPEGASNVRAHGGGVDATRGGCRLHLIVRHQLRARAEEAAQDRRAHALHASSKPFLPHELGKGRRHGGIPVLVACAATLCLHPSLQHLDWVDHAAAKAAADEASCSALLRTRRRRGAERTVLHFHLAAAKQIGTGVNA
mmetsp:Transcript_5000/g.10915  ORF Transcript_5000/g.10915 Transcript_5000/m.10915 type:complete len:240 (-) Transcript_5000:223-942(-)